MTENIVTEDELQFLNKSDQERFCRYLVQRHYFGKWDETDSICACQDIKTAILLTELLSQHYKERMMTFNYKKVAAEYLDFLDDENYDPWSGMEVMEDKRGATETV